MITKKRQAALLAKAQSDVLEALPGPAYEAIVHADGDVDVELRPSWELCTALCRMSDSEPATPRNVEEEKFYLDCKMHALQDLLHDVCNAFDSMAKESAHFRDEIGRVVMEAHTFRSNGGTALQNRRLKDLPDAVADLMRKEMQKNGGDHKTAAQAVYMKVLSVYRDKHPKVKGITKAREDVARRLKVSFATVKRYTGKAV